MSKRDQVSVEIDRDVDGDVMVAGGDIHVDRRTTIFQSARSRAEQLNERNRRILLGKVHSFWIEGVLEKSLHGAARIELGMSEQPEAVDHPWELVLRTLDQEPQPLPAGMWIADVFRQFGQALLILGAPGSGKTTTMLELTRDLLTRAQEDSTLPVPVVVNLSSWAQKRLPLGDWLTDELNARYLVPNKVGKAWIEEDALALLLDGLDEVKAEAREGCVQAINDFRKQHGLTPIVVCSRIADYEILTARLKLEGAVLLQPMSDAQIDRYLASAGKQLAALRSIIRGDPGLRELAHSPLMLSIMMLAYKDITADDLAGLDSPETRRKHLFDVYIERMLKRRPDPRYPPEKCLRWLGWLAAGMQESGQSLFLMERMQARALKTRTQRLLYRALQALQLGILNIPLGAVAGGLAAAGVGPISVSFFKMFDVGGDIGGHGSVNCLNLLLSGPPEGAYIPGLPIPLGWALLTIGMAAGAGGGVLVGLVAGLLEGRSTQADIQPVERLRWSPGWSWSAARNALLGGLGLALFVWAAVVIRLAGRYGLPEVRLFEEGLQLVWASLIGLVIGLTMALVFGLVAGALSGSQIEEPPIGADMIQRRSKKSRVVARLGLAGLILAATAVGFVLRGVAGGCVLGAVVALIVVFVSNMRARMDRAIPNYGTRRSADNALLVGGLLIISVSLAGAGLGAALLGQPGTCYGGYGLSFGAVIGSLVGLIGAFLYGGRAYTQHMALWRIVRVHGYAPADYPRFLDYAADLIILRKVGAGYIFVHRLLMEHLAAHAADLGLGTTAERGDSTRLTRLRVALPSYGLIGLTIVLLAYLLWNLIELGGWPALAASIVVVGVWLAVSAGLVRRQWLKAIGAALGAGVIVFLGVWVMGLGGGNWLRGYAVNTTLPTLVWLPDGERIALGTSSTQLYSREGSVAILDADTGRVVQMLYGDLRAGSPAVRMQRLNFSIITSPLVYSGPFVATLSQMMSLSPDGAYLAFVDQSGNLRIWDVDTGALISFPAPEGGSHISTTAWSPDGTTLAVATFTESDSGVRQAGLAFWPINSGAISEIDEQPLPLESENGIIFGLDWSSEGARLAISPGGPNVIIWDVESGQPTQTFAAEMGDEVLQAVWSPDGRYLATAGHDAIVTIWDVEAERQVQTLTGHARQVMDVAWSPDGARLATAGADQAVMIWDAATGRRLRTLIGHAGPVISVAWSPDGDRLVSAGIDGLVIVWDVSD